MAGMYISEKLLKMINEGGKTEARIDCIEIGIQAVFESANKITDEDTKIRFYGRHYEELANELKELGLVNF